MKLQAEIIDGQTTINLVDEDGNLMFVDMPLESKDGKYTFEIQVDLSIDKVRHILAEINDLFMEGIPEEVIEITDNQNNVSKIVDNLTYHISKEADKNTTIAADEYDLDPDWMNHIRMQ